MSTRPAEHTRGATGELFTQDWWLEAVAAGQWEEARVEEQGKLVARLPYVRRRRYGLTLIGQPPLTPSLGPWLDLPEEGKYAARVSRENELMSALIERLPRFDVFNQHFSPRIQNWLPFCWTGFEATLRYTYRLDDLTDLEAVWAELSSKVRNTVRKAQKALEVTSDLPLAEFLRVNSLTFERQGMSVPYGDDLVERIDDACEERGMRRMLFARDAEGRVHAAWYIVWDEDTTYVLMHGSDPELRASGADSLLAWESIRFAAEVSQAFDFVGSMLKPVERFNRSFGSRQVPYLHVRKLSRRARPLFLLRGLSSA